MELKTVEMHGVAVIEIHGKVVGDVENCHKLHGLFQSLLGEGKRKFVVNLRDVPWMNSLGIGMFIGAYASVKKRGGELVLASPSERVRDVLAVTQLFTLFEVFDTVDIAVDRLTGNARPPVGEPVRKGTPRDRPRA